METHTALAAIVRPHDRVIAIVGNCWPVFLRFRGGKGVATGFGAFLALAPLATAPAALVWVIVTATFRYISLASILACVGLQAVVTAFFIGLMDQTRRS